MLFFVFTEMIYKSIILGGYAPPFDRGIGVPEI